MKTDELTRDGVAPGQARREAERQFGDIEKTRRYLTCVDRRVERHTRWWWFLDDLGQDLRYGIRALGQRPTFVLAATLTLTLGIGANAAIFSVINTLLLLPPPFSHADRIVQIYETNAAYVPTPDKMAVSRDNFLDWRRQSQAFDRLSA